MRLLVRTADRINQGQLTLPPEAERTTTVGDLMEVVRDNFKLPRDADHFMRSERLGTQLDPKMTLQNAGIIDGDAIEVAPILQAGG